MAKTQRGKPKIGPITDPTHITIERVRVLGETVSEPEPLEEEINLYSKLLGGWKEHEGLHVLIRGQKPYGFYATRDEALLEGFRRFGRVPFLVKQVIRDERPRPLGGMIL
jgi:hypothetical protein